MEGKITLLAEQEELVSKCFHLKFTQRHELLMMRTAFPSFILNQPSVATVESLEPSELLLLSYPNQQTSLREVPG